MGTQARNPRPAHVRMWRGKEYLIFHDTSATPAKERRISLASMGIVTFSGMEHIVDCVRSLEMTRSEHLSEDAASLRDLFSTLKPDQPPYSMKDYAYTQRVNLNGPEPKKMYRWV